LWRTVDGADKTAPYYDAVADEIRLVDALGAMGLATDLAMGMPLEHALRSTVIAARIARLAGLDEEAATRAYFLCLLMFIGCTADIHFFAAFMGDEHAVRAKVAPHVYGNVSKMMRAMLSSLGSQESGLARLSIVMRGLSQMRSEMETETAGHCEVAVMLADRFPLDPTLVDHLTLVYERYDGKGVPGVARGDAIPAPVRVMHVARDVDTARCFGGDDAAIDAVRTHAGAGLDPDFARVFLEAPDKILAGLNEGSAWPALLDEEPGERPMLRGDQIDQALAAMGEFADLKTPFTLGRSRAVSRRASDAARIAGLSDDEQRRARRAGSVLDVGRLAVPVLVWERPGPLTADDRERVRLHAYHSERLLAHGELLSPIGSLASLHHERLDGSGYHRACRADAIPHVGRVLAAADVYQAMIESRPHRAAMSPGDAATELRAQAAAGKLDERAVEAVLATAGYTAATPDIVSMPALTEREKDVLLHLSRGLATKQIARQLGISPKTVDNHLQSIYPKLGVSTRAAATLWAARSGILAPG